MSDVIRRFVVLALVIATGVAVYYWERPALPPAALDRQAAAPAPRPESAPAPAPLVRHPVPGPAPGRAPPLPSLPDSDPAVHDRITDLLGGDAMVGLFHAKDYIRRIVVTVDNLTQRRLPQRYAPLKSVPGGFRVSGPDDGPQFISAANYRRYVPYVHLVEAVNIPRLAAAYAYFYPLFQEAYNDLGYQGRYFNDRLIEVIDNLLDTPEVRGPIKVEQPGVYYKFADPRLEKLSAGQKVLLRMGPDNAAHVKARLRELRGALVQLDKASLGASDKASPGGDADVSGGPAGPAATSP